MTKYHARLQAILAITSTLLLGACGGGSQNGDTYAPTGSIVAITPNIANLEIGQTLPMHITGGTGPYSLTSSNPNVISVPNSINNLHAADLSITAKETFETETVTLTVIDNTGSTAKAAITVKAITLAVTPAALTLASTKTQTFHIYGGRPPFIISTTRPDLLTLDTSQLANSQNIIALASEVTTQVDNIQLNITDANAKTIAAKVSVMPNQIFASIQVTPSPQSIASAPQSTASSPQNVASAPQPITTTPPSASGSIVAGQTGLITIKISDNYTVPRTLTIQPINGNYTLDNANANASTQIDAGNNQIALATFSVPNGAVTQTAKLRVTDNTTGKFVDTSFSIVAP